MDRLIDTLRQQIRESLTPLITHDYVLLDCPYHANLGDTLIWEGELDFLRGLPHRMLAYGSIYTWDFRRLDPGTVILLHGGGNFGDLWRWFADFRLQVIENYPENSIIVLPQTVHYEDTAVMIADAARMARHPALTLCARDEHSYGLLEEYFHNRILLLPDMAFCIDSRQLDRWRSRSDGTRPLWLKRTDKELAAVERSAEIPPEAVVRDWPTCERIDPITWAMYRLQSVCLRLARFPRLRPLWRLAIRIADGYAMHILRPDNIRIGVRFLSRYGDIHTTRLHGAILAILLEKKKIVLLDNTYGKNSTFYRTWLSGEPTIHLSLNPDGTR